MTATEVPFERSRGLLVVRGRIEGPRGEYDLNLALDTGSGLTYVTHDVLDEIGYNASDGIARIRVTSAVDVVEHGYTAAVRRFTCLGHDVKGFVVGVLDLPPGHGIDGLLGLTFLDRFNYEIRSVDGVIRAEPA